MPDQHGGLSDQKERLWGHEPVWWSAIFSIFNIVVLGLFFAGMKWISDVSDKNQLQKREIYDLRLRLASDEGAAYRQALDGLLALGSEGQATLAQILEDMKKHECIRWSKARTIASRLKASGASENTIGDTIEIAFKSWNCAAKSLQNDLELAQLLKNSERACSTVLAHADNIADPFLLRFAVGVVIVQTACPRKIIDGPEFQNLLLRFQNALSETIEKKNKEAVFYGYGYSVNPLWQGRIEEAGDVDPYEGQRAVLEILDLFHAGGRDGDQVLWRELVGISRWERVMFSQFLCVPRQEGATEKCDEKTKERLKRYVSSALESSDVRARFAAVAAVGNLQWGSEFKGDLERIRKTDTDAQTRLKAERVLDLFFAPRD